MTVRDQKPDETTATEAERDAQTKPGERETGAHTEVRRSGTGPRPRSKVLPPDSGDEPGEDDPFNDVPV